VAQLVHLELGANQNKTDLVITAVEDVGLCFRNRLCFPSWRVYRRLFPPERQIFHYTVRGVFPRRDKLIPVWTYLSRQLDPPNIQSREYTSSRNMNLYVHLVKIQEKTPQMASKPSSHLRTYLLSSSMELGYHIGEDARALHTHCSSSSGEDC